MGLMVDRKEEGSAARINNMSELDIEEGKLIKRCQSGDQVAFKKLFERYQQKIYIASYNILGDHDIARDVVQETFVRVFKNIKNFNRGKHFYTWLYQIAINVSIDFLRKRARNRETGADVTIYDKDTKTPTRCIVLQETKDKVRQIISMLPDKYKIVLALRDIQGLSCEEIAEIIGCKSITARWRIYQARKIFKALWTDTQPGNSNTRKPRTIP